MKNKKHLLIHITFALCVILLSDLTVRGEALNWMHNRKALAGIESFALQYVVVCEFPTGTNAEVIEHTDELKQWILTAFGAHGIEVYSFDSKGTQEENTRFLDADAELYVRITDVLPLYLTDIYSYCVTIYVVDWVSTKENRDIHFKAITWADCRGSISRLSLLKSNVRDTLDKILDELIKDYLYEHAEKLTVLSNLNNESRSNVEIKEQAGHNWLGIQILGALLIILGVVVLNRRSKNFSKL